MIPYLIVSATVFIHVYVYGRDVCTADEIRTAVKSLFKEVRLVMYQGGRVVKALDLRSNVRMHTWVRTPFLVMGPCRPTVFLLFFFLPFHSFFFLFL